MKENTNKEINLLQLINLFFNWVKNIGKKLMKFLVYTIQLCYRNKIIVLIILVLSLAVGQYFARKSNRIYKAEAMAMIYGSQAPTVKEVFKQLENSLASNKLISLATKLSLPDSVAQNIVEINSYYVIDYLKDGTPDKIDFNNNHSLTDTLNIPMRDRIYLQIKTKSIGQVPQVQKAILNFLNNNEVINNQFNIKKTELQEKINICIAELQRVDSLAKVSYFKDNNQQMRFENNKLFIGEQKKQLLYPDLLEIQKTKYWTEVELGDYKQPIDLPSGFVVNPTPVNGRVYYAIYSLLIGFLLSIIVSVIVENFKKINKFLNNN